MRRPEARGWPGEVSGTEGAGASEWRGRVAGVGAARCPGVRPVGVGLGVVMGVDWDSGRSEGPKVK